MEIYREIKERPPERSRAVTWIIRFIALLAVPVVYLLSVPPLILETLGAQTASEEGQAGAEMQSPRWVQFYAIPYDWAASTKLLRKPLDGYAEWCMTMAER